MYSNGAFNRGMTSSSMMNPSMMNNGSSMMMNGQSMMMNGSSSMMNGSSSVSPSRMLHSSQPAGSYSTRASGNQTIQSERILSSNIVGETMLGPMPQEENVQYVEVPVVEEVIRHIPKKEYVEVEKRVPKFEYEWIERVVEVPQIHYVEKTVEIPQIQEVICHVPVKQVVEIPKEIIRRVPKIETKIVEKEIEVPGEIIEVPKPYLVENKIIVPRYTNKEVATVVAQRLVPVISESETEFVDVDLKEYNPYLVPVDVYVPRPVSRQLIAASKTEEHRVVDVPVGQFNALVKQLNTHCQESDITELLVKDIRSNAVPVMPLTSGSIIVAPVNNEWELQHEAGALHYSHNASVGTVGGTHTTSSSYITGANTITGTQAAYLGGSTTTTHHQKLSSPATVYTGGAGSTTTTSRVHSSSIGGGATYYPSTTNQYTSSSANQYGGSSSGYTGATSGYTGATSGYTGATSGYTGATGSSGYTYSTQQPMGQQQIHYHSSSTDQNGYPTVEIRA